MEKVNNLSIIMNNKFGRLAVIIAIAILSLSKIVYSQTGESFLDYLGLGPPADSAIIFKTSLISPDYNIFGFVLSPAEDELFLTVYKDKSGTILHSKLTGSVWSELDTSFLAKEKGLETITMSPAGRLLTFSKANPIPGWPYNTDLYFCRRTDTGWSNAQPFPEVINSEFRESGHALTLDRTLYFASGRPTDDHMADIFRAKCNHGEYTSAEYIPGLSTPGDEDGIWISPDESNAIVESWQDENKKDLYISFRKDDAAWTKLKNMGPKINSRGFEGTPKVSNDGKYLLFWSDRTGILCLHWIRVDKIISDLKKEIFKSINKK